MDATLASLEAKASQQKAEARQGGSADRRLENGAMSSRAKAKHKLQLAEPPGKP
jgi:hypothetical protein